MTTQPRVGLVGHCVPDAYALRSAVGRALPGVEFILINDSDSLADKAGACDLLLINRVLDGDFDDEGGIAMIRRLGVGRAAGARPALMLVSNFPEAQAEAVGAGAVPGFGKTEMNTARGAERLRGAVVGGGPAAG